MKLYLECAMGASGDMLMSALYELLPDKAAFRQKMEELALPGVTFEYLPSMKCGIVGTRINVIVGGIEEKSDDAHPNDAQHHVGAGFVFAHPNDAPHPVGADPISAHDHPGKIDYKSILELIQNMDLPMDVKENALDVYRMIGEAEATVHGAAPDNIHLHEIGSLDAVADVVGCCLLMHMLGVTDVSASPVHVGSGSVRCAHGILPVPAPAAAELLRGIPIYGGRIKAELCTPTGAALLKCFAARFGDMPPMIVKKIGCGMGTKDFEAANCLRAFLYESVSADGAETDSVCEIRCNLDDMTPEAIGAVFELLLENGALDVSAAPIMMKKNRPGVMLSCLCAEEKRDSLAQMILVHTTTLGVRMASCSRLVMSRAVETVHTEFGDIRVKRAHGFGAEKCKPEFDDVLQASKRCGVPFTTVYDAARTASPK